MNVKYNSCDICPAKNKLNNNNIFIFIMRLLLVTKNKTVIMIEHNFRPVP